MNEEVRKQRKEVLKRIDEDWKLKSNAKNVKYFYKGNIDNFKKEESKKALAKILEYIKKTSEKLKVEQDEINKMLKNLGSICDHEILLPTSGFFSHQCPICMKSFNSDNFPSTTQFIVDDSRYGSNYWEIQKIKEAIEKMITKDDFIEELDEFLSNLQEEKDIKVRRRYL